MMQFPEAIHHAVNVIRDRGQPTKRVRCKVATNTLTLDEINLIKNSEEVKDTKLYGNFLRLFLFI